MASQALYRQYRSQTFDELIGQEHVVQTLRNALGEGRIAHAYLFTGPRGVGKTTVARLLAKAVNCTSDGQRPCGVCASCRSIAEGRAVDVIEMDAASHTSVDDARELIERVQFRPTSARFKVYVIDECFRYEDLITLADGSKQPIGKIVESGWPVEVLSYNEHTRQIEPKPVVRHMRKQPTMPMVRITFDNNRTLTCTINHKFYTPQGKIHAGELEVGQFVYANYERVTQHQLDVVAGAALGDGHLSLTDSKMRARLSITQGVAQKAYLDYKAQLLSDLVETPAAYQYSPQSFSKSGLAISMVKKIERVPPTEFVYNIEVADNHNYFVRDILVANCHMLSTAAFNALLKTLEEPPGHALFILATTESHKVPATILSRCQRFTFNRHTIAATVGHLQRIATEEHVTLEPGVAEAIARTATGSMRDALSVLDQLMAYGSGTIRLDQVRDLLGATEAREVAALVDALLGGDLSGALRTVAAVAQQGADLRQFVRDLVEHLRALLLLKAAADPALLDATEDELAVLHAQAAAGALPSLLAWVKLFSGLDHQLRTSPYGQLPLELAVVEAIAAPAMATAAPPERAAPAPRAASRQMQVERAPDAAPPPSAPQPRRAQAAPVASEKRPDEAPAQQPSPRPAAAQPPLVEPTSDPDLPGQGAEGAVTDAAPDALVDPPLPPLQERDRATTTAGADQALSPQWLENHWEEIVYNVRPYNVSLPALLRGCTPGEIEANTARIWVKHSFHKQKLEQRQNIELIEKIIADLAGQRLLVQFEMLNEQQDVLSAHQRRKQRAELRKDPHISAAVRIFDADIEEIEPLSHERRPPDV